MLSVRGTLEIPPSRSFANLRVVISNPKRNSPRDRNLRVVFYTKSWGSGMESFSYSVPVQLAEGQNQVVVEIPHVHIGMQSAWDIAVYENGRDIEDKRQRPANQMPYQWTYNESTDSAYAILQGTNEASFLVNRELAAMSDYFLEDAQANTGVRTTATRAAGKIIPIKEAKTDWRTYFPYSAWVASASTVGDINANFPEVGKALRTYVASGGTLFIHSAGSPTDMEQIDILLQSKSASAGSGVWSSQKAPKAQWWWQDPANFDEFPQASAKGNEEDDAANSELSGMGAAHDAALAAETWVRAGLGGHVENISEITRLLGASDGPFLNSDDLTLLEYQQKLREYRYNLIEMLASEEILRREYLGGTVLVSAKPVSRVSTDLLTDTLATASTLNANVTATQSMDGNWFWRNLIAAVGKPPVWIFCVIVGLFGALLGPGLLYLTGRVGRRSLMIFLVPSISLTATAAIITYGILHEGFDSHVRVTSLTRIDGDSGTAFAWSRQNFFSGLPPREGLDFRKDTYARPVYGEEQRNYSSSDPRDGIDCRVSLTDKQNWKGWLRPRQHQQLLVGHSIDQPAMPVLLKRTNQGLQIKNTSGQTLPFVVVRGAEDDYYYVEDLQADAETTLLAQAKDDIGSGIAKKVLDFRPEAPPELLEGGSLLSFGSRRRQRITFQSISTDVINQAYSTYLTDRLDMSPNSFATILGSNDAIEVPLEGAHSQDIHIVIGHNAW